MKWRRLWIVMAALIGEGKADPLERRCVEHTSRTWGVPVELLQAIHEIEAGKPGVKHRNPNGSVDLGSMQHNSRTAMALQKKFGVDPEMLLWSECYAVYVSGWELASSAYQHQDWRLAIAAYNAGDTAVLRAVKGHGGIPKDISDLNLPHSTKFEYVPRVMEAWARYLSSKPQ
jgi:soluble lytic murein transglycosylase-like protein